MMYVVRLELMQNGDCHRTISDYSQESDHPMGTVTPANGNLVTRTDSSILQYNMHLGYLPCYVLIA